MLRCNFLRSSGIWVHLSPATSMMRPRFDTNKIKVVYLRCTRGAVGTTFGSRDWLPVSGSKKSGWWYCQGNWWLKGCEDYNEADHPQKTGSAWGGAICLCPDHQNPQGTAKRQEKKQKNIKHRRNVTFDEIVNIAGQMQHQPLTRDLAGTIEEILGTASLWAAMWPTST